MISAEQIKAARALLRMEQDELARRASVSVTTIRRLEAAGAYPVAEATAGSVEMALLGAGVDFIPDGVCLKRKSALDKDELFEKLLAIAAASARQIAGQPPAREADLYADDG